MHAPDTSLKSLSSIQLTTEEHKMIDWLKAADWKPHATIPESFTAKVPELYGGVRLFNMQATGGAGAAQGPLALFIKKIEFQGIITKQEMYPVTLQDNGRYISLKKIDMENLGIGDDPYDDGL